MIIRKMKGAHQMLPDPDWKAEGQKGARARTSAGTNNDDDNQVCCWNSFNEGSGEEE